MNKRLFIRGEATRWRNEGIITQDQWERIIARYPDQHKASTLPILAGVLFGLGVLTFIASNWDGISNMTRLAIIFVSLLLAYWSGDRLMKKGYERVGLALTMLGIAIYGAGFFLIGQMYHLSANPANAFYLWFVGSMAMAWHYRSHVLAVVSLVILFTPSIYSWDIGRDAWTIFWYYALFAAGVVPFVWKFRTKLLTRLALVTLVLLAVRDVADIGGGFVYVPLFFVMLLASLLLPPTASEVANGLRLSSYLGIFGFALFIIFEGEAISTVNTTDSVLFAVMLGLLGLFIFLTIRRKERILLSDIIPYLPPIGLYLLALLQGTGTHERPFAFLFEDVALILALFFSSVGMVLGGEKIRDIARINTGAVLFGLTCFVGYTNFAWDFMDKSLFFLLGGALLLLLSFFIERQRRKWVQDAKEGENHE